MKSLLSKKIVLISLITVLLIGTGVATTLAYISSKPKELTNTFAVGNVTTEIVEDTFQQVEGTRTFLKEPYVKNTGINDCYVRVRVVCSPQNALVLEQSTVIREKWKLRDGFYYYDDVLPAPSGNGESKTAYPVFEKVVVTDPEIDGFEVTVYQEAVQTRVYAADGTFTDNAQAIWECYDTGVIPDTFNTTE